MAGDAVAFEVVALEEGAGFLYFLIDVGSFIEDEAGDGAEAWPEGFEEAWQGGEGAGDEGVKGLMAKEFFAALGFDGYVGEFEGTDGFREEAGLLLDRLDKGDLGVGEENGEGDARESGAGTDVGERGDGLDEGPGEDGIKDVLDGGLASGGDAGEVHGAVGLDDEGEVAGAECDEAIAVGGIGGEDGLEFGGELGFGDGHWIYDATGSGERGGLTPK